MMTQIKGGGRTRIDETTEPISARVVDAVAAAVGVDPLDLDDRLFDVINPDALNKLFEPGPFGAERLTGTVTFRMAGCDVVVGADGDVTATELEA